MAVSTWCLVALLVVAASAKPSSSSEEEGQYSKAEIMYKLGKLVKMEAKLREKSEYLVENYDELEEVQERFFKFLKYRKMFAEYRAMKGKEDMIKEAFKHFMEKMKGKMGSSEESRESGERREREESGERRERREVEESGERREESDESGEKSEAAKKIKAMALWKLFMEFQAAVMQQNNVMAAKLDDKKFTQGLFFETFLRFMRTANLIETKAKKLAETAGMFEEAKEKIKASQFKLVDDDYLREFERKQMMMKKKGGY